MFQYADTIDAWMREVYFLLVALLLATFETRPEYIFTYFVLATIRNVTNVFWVEGIRTPGLWKRFIEASSDTAKVLVMLAVITAFGNMETPFGWITQAAYVFFCGRLVRETINSLTTVEGDARKFLAWLSSEVLRRNKVVLDIDTLKKDGTDATREEEQGPGRDEILPGASG